MEDRSRQAILNIRIVCVWLVLCLSALTVSCKGTLPTKSRDADSYAAPQDTQRVLAGLRSIDPKDHGADHSAFMMLNRGEDALRWRLALIDNAEQTLDMQYYMWHHDAAGTLLLDRAIRAAERGVRVRLIIDDGGMVGSEEGATVLSSHPNFEIRVFNPFVDSSKSQLVRLFEFAGDFARLNHRMHNKMLVVDNALTVLGGRNIGDEYFGLSKMTFRDMDLVGLGPIATEVSDAFDMYWNSPWAVPPKALKKSSRENPSAEQQRAEAREAREKYPEILAKIEKNLETHREVLSAFVPHPDERSGLIADFKERAKFGKAAIAVDTPPTQKGQQATEVAFQVRDLLLSAQSEVLIVSPYLVPTENGVELIGDLIDKGVKVRILTNSLASNDVIPAQAVYAVYRESLVNCGAELHELRADSATRALYSTQPVQIEVLGLHAKAVVVDRQRSFVGTMNLDPRSMVHNTEVGVIVDSPELARDLLDAFATDLSTDNSWLVHYDADGFIQYTSGDETTYLQPAQNSWQRIMFWLSPGPAFEWQF